ncbi:hypothetical protein [Legionella longbeachae]|uniref:Ankyrin repeat protein n=1 Tax=Legionella longbeachae serogroup 1 (strain NSW150) TaxID=661367 RepID=D3HIW1_LEGLN|nr:hypothetical protein [Legionella longbeachae]HBD7398024.1 hypothetical protein [Legionella pneumophila]ARM32661.3 hypothetical protein B0B39_03635 [Legionella longbeachae]QIN32593.1 hypothetical protein GCB94_10795 [Legionella longbeachae]QIN35946.1 hypothetical protein GCS73_10055 [Legionella longbeachae]RZV21546.1 hypothetical protein EKG34_16590 [Legionella longbeachae]
MMTITELLSYFGHKESKNLTQEIAHNIAQIKEICDNEFHNQSFYGNSALNRLMLLNERIANLLTPEVIEYLFTNEPTDQSKIFRNSSGMIALKDAIYHGFNDGLIAIKLMTNNEQKFGPEQYEAQKANYDKNTTRIVENIKIAAGIAEKIEDDISKAISVSEKFEHIVETIDNVKKADKSDKLLYVPGYTPQSMRSQVKGGFSHLCSALKIEFDKEFNEVKNETLDSLCEKFLNSSSAMLEGTVIHLFYDRAHIEAAIEQDTVITIGGVGYHYQDIFRAMVSKIDSAPEKYPACAKEQFDVRLTLVMNDLEKRKKEFEPDSLIISLDAKTQFLSLLHEIKSKVKAFKHNNQPRAAKAASKLHTQLSTASLEYFKAEYVTRKNYKIFNELCANAIQEARPVLEKHRGWKDIFAKLIVGIATLGIVPAAMAIKSKIQTGSFSFRLLKTASHKQLDIIEKQARELEPIQTISMN